MHTLGFRFKPWTDAKSIADGPSILDYVRETADEAGIDDRIRFHHRVVAAAWSSDGRALDGRGRAHRHGARRVQLTCGFLFMCSGYYRYDEGYTPEFPGIERFGGQVVHPQHWPEDLDYAGKRVVVIGSGATAVTLVPAMAETAAHVTMLQRSPTYVVSLPGEDPIANCAAPRPAREGRLRARPLEERPPADGRLPAQPPPAEAGQEADQRKARSRPCRPATTSTSTSTRSYDPWDQRLCLVPTATSSRRSPTARAEIVTDRIETFTESGDQARVRARSSRPTS